MPRTPIAPPPNHAEADPSADTSAGAIPQPSAGAHHDATIQWVISDHMALGETPEPIVLPDLAPDKPAAVPEPQPPAPAEPATEAQAGISLGATPEDFLAAGPTPPPPGASPSEETIVAIAETPALADSPSDSSASMAADSFATPEAEPSFEARQASPSFEAPSTNEVEDALAALAALAIDPMAKGPSAESQPIEIGEVEPEAVIVTDSSLNILEATEGQAATLPPATLAPPAPPPTPPPAPTTLLPGSTTPPPAPRTTPPSGSLTPPPAPPTTPPPVPEAELAKLQRSEPSAAAADNAPQSATSTQRVARPVSASEPTVAVSDSPASQIVAAALFEEYQAPSEAEDTVHEALARRPLQKQAKPWFEEVFSEDYLRTTPAMTAEQTTNEVEFIRDALAMPEGGAVLDLACGYGRHAIEMAQRGFKTTGLDLSLPLLIKAGDTAQKRGLSVNFIHADMREMEFDGEFDGAYCVLSSFGYFDEETNLRVASSLCRALKPGGRFLLDIVNRDYVVGDLPSRVWWEGEGCVVLEEVDFNYHTSRILIRRSVVFADGRQSEQEVSVRAYSLHEMGRLLRHAGLRVLEVSGAMATKSRFFGAASKSIIALCERQAP